MEGRLASPIHSLKPYLHPPLPKKKTFQHKIVFFKKKSLINLNKYAISEEEERSLIKFQQIANR
jgi:hypothetical protein